MGKTPPIYKGGSLQVDEVQTYVNQKKFELKPGKTFTFEDEKRWREEATKNNNEKNIF